MVSSNLKFSVDILSLRATIPSKTSPIIPTYMINKTRCFTFTGFKKVKVMMARKKTNLLYKSILGIFCFNFPGLIKVIE